MTDEHLGQIERIEYKVTVGVLSAQIQLALWLAHCDGQEENQGSTVVLHCDEKG